MVRCAAESRSHIFTGAEDGKICAWKKSSIVELEGGGSQRIISPSISTTVIQSIDNGRHYKMEVEVEVEEPLKIGEEGDDVEDDDDESNDSNRRKRIRCNNIA